MANEVKIKINADSTGAVEGVNKTAAAVEGLSQKMQAFSRISSIVAAGAAIIVTLRKVAEAVDAVINSFNRPTEGIRVGNLTARVHSLADAYARVTGEIGKSASAQERAASAASAAAAALVDRQAASIDKDAAAAIVRDPARRDSILADAEVRKRALISTSGQEAESAALDANSAAIQSAQARAAAAARAGASAAEQVAAANQNRAAISERVKQDTSFSASDLFGGRFTEDPRYAAAHAKWASFIQQADKAAADALALVVKARDDEAAAQIEIDALRDERSLIERQGVTRRLRDETADLNARAEAALKSKARVAAVDRELDSFFGPIDTAAKDRDQVRADTQAKIAAITVDAPRAASALGASGGIMGGSMNNSFRLQQQRDEKILTYHREEVELLAKIDAKLTE